MISAIVLTRNEEENITYCLQSLSFCDEILIIDDNSTDKTVELAEKAGAKIIKRKLEQDFASQRNYASQQAKGDWLLYLDADEILSPQLKKEIQEVMKTHKSHDPQAYYLKRRDFFWNHEILYGETTKVRREGLLRFMKKESGTWKGKVHEEFHTSKKNGQLHGFIDHYPHQTITSFLQEINYYSSLRAEELAAQKHKASFLETFGNPFFKFLYTYIILLGFADGPAGFVYSFFMSFHSFLVRAKLYQKQI